jgi:hypothetical protein
MSDASGGSSAQSSSKAPPSGAGVPGVSVPILTTSSASLSTSSTLATPVTGAAPASPIPSLLLHSIDGAGVTASPLSPKGTGTLRPKQRERLIKVISGETVEVTRKKKKKKKKKNRSSHTAPHLTGRSWRNQCHSTRSRHCQTTTHWSCRLVSRRHSARARRLHLPQRP